jgi:glyoxylase I family protein
MPFISLSGLIPSPGQASHVPVSRPTFRSLRSSPSLWKLWLHHINLCTTAVPAMDELYRSVLGLEPEPGMNASRVTGQGHPGDVSFVTDGTTQVHLAERDLEVGFRTGKPVNPMERGHIAFRTDDIETFKGRLEEKGIPYADYGGWASSRFSSTIPKATSSRSIRSGRDPETPDPRMRKDPGDLRGPETHRRRAVGRGPALARAVHLGHRPPSPPGALFQRIVVARDGLACQAGCATAHSGHDRDDRRAL